MSEEPEEQLTEEQTIAQEYETWKKNCPAMYEFVAETALTWPSLTVQWMPNVTELDNGNISQDILVGTYTAGSEDQEYVEVGKVELPGGFRANNDSGSATIIPNSRVKITKKMKHDGEPNRARYMWQQPNIIGTSSVSGKVYVYDQTASVSNEGGQDDKSSGNLVMVLDHHTMNGYGISWNKHRAGWLLTGSDDKTVAVWDVEQVYSNSSSKTKSSGSTATTSPIKVLSEHSEGVNDVAWHERDSNIFGSVSDDGYIYLYDARTWEKVGEGYNGHKDGQHLQSQQSADSSASASSSSLSINSLSFSPFSQYMLATVSDDELVALWDRRNMSRKLHSLVGHSGKVTCVQWSPYQDGLLGSAGADRRVILWDIRKIGQEQSAEDAEDAVPELVFMHGGHTSGIVDMDWNAELPGVVASVAEDNVCQIWKASNKLLSGKEYEGEEEEEAPREDELE